MSRWFSVWVNRDIGSRGQDLGVYDGAHAHAHAHAHRRT
jgi:hypothetical protein